MDEKDFRINELLWQRDVLKKTLEWYASDLRPEDRLSDNGERAADALEDISNKN